MQYQYVALRGHANETGSWFTCIAYGERCDTRAEARASVRKRPLVASSDLIVSHSAAWRLASSSIMRYWEERQRVYGIYHGHGYLVDDMPRCVAERLGVLS